MNKRNVLFNYLMFVFATAECATTNKVTVGVAQSAFVEVLSDKYGYRYR